MKTILLVDDELDLLKLLASTLKDVGHTVKTASSGDQALELLKDPNNKFDLVISDQIMKGGTGIDLILDSKDLENPPPIYIFSGGIELEKAIIDNGGAGLIYKPCPINDIIKLIQNTGNYISDSILDLSKIKLRY